MVRSVASFVVSLLTCALLSTSVAVARDEDSRLDAMRIADEAHEMLAYLEEDARFLAQGAIGVGDTQSWNLYNDFSFRVGIVARQFKSYANDLANTMLPLRMIEQNYAMNTNDRRQLQTAFARLRMPPEDFVERYAEYGRSSEQLAGLIATPPEDPNAEPDVPGRWECSATWSMNGTSMSFRGQGDSRNAAKAEALRQCEQRFTRFCQLGSCRQLGVMTPVRRPGGWFQW